MGHVIVENFAKINKTNFAFVLDLLVCYQLDNKIMPSELPDDKY